MTKDVFIARYLDETVGLLVGAFSHASASRQHKLADDSYAADGKFMIAQMQRARALLGRMWDDLNQKTSEVKK